MNKCFAALAMFVLSIGEVASWESFEEASCCASSCYYYYQEPSMWRDISVTGEYLLWRARGDNLSIGQMYTVGSAFDPGANNGGSSNMDGFAISFSPLHAKDQLLQPKWSSGSRFKVEAKPACSNLLFGLAYTDYNTKAFKNVESVIEPSTLVTGSVYYSGTLFIPYFNASVGLFNPTPGLNAEMTKEYSSDYGLHLHELDFRVSYPFSMGNCFSFLPFVALRGLDLRQTIHITGSTFALSDSGAVTEDFTSLTTARYQTRFQGLGLALGTALEYTIGFDVSLFGSSSVVLFYGKQELDHLTELTTIDDLFGELKYRYRYDQGWRELSPAFDAAIGLRFSSTPFCGVQAVIDISWEYHNYFGQNAFRYDLTEESIGMHANRPKGDLETFGGVIAGKLVF